MGQRARPTIRFFMSHLFAFERLRALDKSENPAEVCEREELREQLAEQFRGLAVSVATEMCPKLVLSKNNDLDDLIGEAHLAMVRALDRFDPARGGCFSTFAALAIKGALRRYGRDRAQIIREPAWVQERRSESDEGVAAFCAGLPGHDDASANLDGIAHGDFVIGAQARVVWEQFAGECEARAGELTGCKREWARREVAVLRLHLEGKTRAEIAQLLGISASNATYYVNRALPKFKAFIADNF